MNGGKLKRILRWVGVGMCLVAAVFLAVALSHPELGTSASRFGRRSIVSMPLWRSGAWSLPS